MTQADDERWMEGRTRPVRVVLTEEEHATVRQAAALADKSVSRFSVEAVVEAAKNRMALGPMIAEPTPAKKAAPKRKKEK